MRNTLREKRKASKTLPEKKGSTYYRWPFSAPLAGIDLTAPSSTDAGFAWAERTRSNQWGDWLKPRRPCTTMDLNGRSYRPSERSMNAPFDSRCFELWIEQINYRLNRPEVPSQLMFAGSLVFRAKGGRGWSGRGAYWCTVPLKWQEGLQHRPGFLRGYEHP